MQRGIKAQRLRRGRAIAQALREYHDEQECIAAEWAEFEHDMMLDSAVYDDDYGDEYDFLDIIQEERRKKAMWDTLGDDLDFLEQEWVGGLYPTHAPTPISLP